MTSIDLQGKKLLLVSVPEKAGNFEVIDGRLHYMIVYAVLHESSKELPEGNWRILGSGKASEIEEWMWKELIPEMKVGERYPNYNGDYPIWFYSRRESGLSLLTHHGYKLSEVVVLINN